MVKSSLNYLTIFPNNGNLWKSFWGNDVFVNLPTGFGKSFIFRCLLIVADVVHSKPKHAYVTSAYNVNPVGLWMLTERSKRQINKHTIALATPNNMSVKLLHLITLLRVIPSSPSCLFCVSGIHRERNRQRNHGSMRSTRPITVHERTAICKSQ